MKFPKQLIITLRSKINLEPLPNKALFLVIKPPRKNDYDVGPRLTDSIGQAIFTEDEVQNTIEWTQQQWIMDYAGKYEDCSSTFLVFLPNIENIQRSKKLLTDYKKVDEKFMTALKMIGQATNNNLRNQEWKFDADKFQGDVVQIECLVD